MAAPPVTNAVAERIESSLLLLWDPDQVAELRILNTQRAGSVSGYFDDPARLARAAANWSGRAEGVYWTLNPVVPALLARRQNRIEEKSKNATDDKQIARRRWLPIDFDPRRPAGISSTDHEKQLARARCIACRDWLGKRGWPAPIMADSGNGYHLLYRVELPNSDQARDLVQRNLQALALRFEDEQVQVDVTNFNASRIWKLYGTMACKGDNTPDRPHRQSAIVEVP